ncbi:MAG TPA: RNA polymerase-associated protein RapA [Candidatus Acidoferrum sp.]|nr:RNA polymerase-associated protein RapA [Candidatus Acidoferrum sp.]
MATENYHRGQRWISESEPELGLGSVLGVTNRTVTIVFGASGETREYARDNAPLRRVRFRAGDTIKDHEGNAWVVQSFTERNGLIFYRSSQREVCETELNDAISFNKPEERLLAGQVDAPDLFDLRVSALTQQHRRRQSKVRGFVGGRIDLIPHQLYIASEVARRLTPRVLLADEVGLGKTIEACLILHRLILTGRARRVLIVVPDSLVHQWFVELLRRFNLWFHIFDEERCESIEASDAEVNPFLDDQLVLCSISLFIKNEQRLQQALAAGWDMLVVDEAHHLGWAPTAVSREYAVVEALSRNTPGLLLLTATPEQLGMASHFARLRLLDSDRFYDLHEFIAEAEHYRDVARIVDELLNGLALAGSDIAVLARLLADNEANVMARLEKIGRGDIRVRDELMSALLDQHGTGRVMFRNTRATISGFPKRNARMHSLKASAENTKLFDALAEEFAADTSPGAAATFQPDFADDPRMVWLAELLRSLDQEKLLVICRTQRKVEAIDAALRQRLNVKIAVFHEGLALVQRDRNAAWFAEEDGARILICSEIGSEGRNFQFAHHLALFDLPLDPELLEQRIGRLDRIGQTAEIQVHVPFVTGSSHEVLARWYQDGLNAFEKNLAGGRVLLEQFGARVHDLAQDFHETEETSRGELNRLIEETIAARTDLTAQLEQGRDRLLELNSFRTETAASLIDEIQREDGDQSLDAFMVAVFDHYSIHVEELAPRTYRLGSAGVFADSFPGLPAEGFTVTGDRGRALSREEVQFLTRDHPLVTGALDLLLGSEKGNSSFAHWPDKTSGIYLEAVYLIECIAPPHLHVDRFLPPTPLRVLVDHRGHDVRSTISTALSAARLNKGDPYPLLERPEFREELLPGMIKSAETIASSEVAGLVAQARTEMLAQLQHEIARLKELQKVNRSVRPQEIEMLVEQQRGLEQHLSGARLRLDAIRVIQRGPR